MRERAIRPNPNLCNVCGKGQIVFDGVHGEYYCSLCGYIVDDSPIDFSDISSFFNYHKSPLHSIVNTIKINKGLGTDLDKRVAAFAKIKNRYLMKNSINKTERNFSSALPYLQLAWAWLSIPEDIRIGSAMLYRKCINKGITNGRKTEVIVSAIIALKCENAKIMRDKNKLLNLFELHSYDIERYKALVDNVLKIIYKNNIVKSELSAMLETANNSAINERAFRIFDFVANDRHYGHMNAHDIALKIFDYSCDTLCMKN